MKHHHLVLCLVLFTIALASGRLPLPKSVQETQPELLSEPITGARIVGGKNATSAPHQIALFRNGTFICSGSLIASRSVVTSAHCVFGYENKPSHFRIRYGSLLLNNGTEVNVSRIVRHPSYSSSTLDYDVAVLTLSVAFKPSSNAAIIALSSSTPPVGSPANVTGWGRLTVNGGLSNRLQVADSLKVLSRADCQKRWGSGTTITDRMICAHSANQSVCNGDSGGPLTQWSPSILIGIVSWGPSSCLHATYPNVYVNVTNLRSWIQAYA